MPKKTRDRTAPQRRARVKRVAAPRLTASSNPSYRINRWVGSNAFGLSSVSASSGAGITLNTYLNFSTSAVQGLHYFSWGVAFKLSDLPSYTEFTALFERYRIDRVELTMIRSSDVSPAAGVSGNPAAHGVIHSALDLDDYAAPVASEAGVDALRQRADYKVQSLVGAPTLSWTWQPRVAPAVYAGAITTGYANVQPLWIDAANPDVEHYGMKFVFEVANPTAAVVFESVKCQARIFASFTGLQ